ncbi:MAG TPA: family 20 glycosylhydrolase, partial [Saprospiraceae bacterium]|nr:family 20 glycosylhydrolase [Saprospiraceae bacterium]
MRFHVLSLLLSALPLLATCQPPSPVGIQIIPQPLVVKPAAGVFTLSPDTRVYFPEGLADWQTAAHAWVDLAKAGANLSLVHQGIKEKFTTPRANSINFVVDPTLTHAEGYILEVKPTAVIIRARTAAGAFYAVQTLRQLFPPALNWAGTATAVATESAKAGGKKGKKSDPAPARDVSKIKWTAPCCVVQDAPRFAYRGLHLDVGRHFFPVSFIKKYIDLLAMHKLNTFHWHLTDDQGWRIEIKKYPRLHTVGGCRAETLVGHYSDQPHKFDGKKYCGFYTQDEIKEVVEYAKKRFVTILPEIEMPGHALAALAAYPDLGCSGGPYEVAKTWGIFEDVFCPTEKTFQFLDDVLGEVCALFPGAYVHIGGDECPKTSWEKSEFCQQLMKREGLKDGHELQSYFIKRVETMLAKRDKKLIGWDEILEGGLAPTATVMSWRGTEGGIAAAKSGHDAIMTPGSHLYLDYYQSDPTTEPVAIGGYLTLEKVYSYEPIPGELSAEEAKHILGAQGNVWTEYMPTSQQVEYMAYPRACALAEVVWTAKEKKNWKDFSKRIKTHLLRLDAAGVNAAKTYYDVNAAFSKGRITLSSLDPNSKIYFTTDGKEPTAKSKMYTGPISITKNTSMKAVVIQDGAPMGKVRSVDYLVHKASGKTYKMDRVPDKYTGGEQYGLTNGVTGNIRTWNAWVGLVNRDIDPVIDLSVATEFSRVTTHFVNSRPAWIYPPRAVEVLGSNDGKKFVSLAKKEIAADKLSGVSVEEV